MVGITGASGVLYGIRFVQVLRELGHEIALVVSDAGRLVLQEELQTARFSDLFDPLTLEKVTVYSNKDLAAPIASGSYPTQGMVIIPCSMGTLGHLAAGVTQNLIYRAADCTMQEGRRLVIVPRETPLSAIHLENLLKLARLGVRVLPANPGFYSGAQTIQDLVDFVVGKVLDALEIPHAVYPRWTGRTQRVA